MTKPEPSREGFLDLLRFLAAISVVLFHYGFRGHAQGGYLTLSYSELAPFARYGYLGVELFFMISGYVILWSISGRKVSQFAVHRFIRLYPTFWLCALLTLAVEHLTGAVHLYPGDLSAAANVTMVPTWLGLHAIDEAYWSLATELEFYILVGSAVWLLGFERLSSVLVAWVLYGFVMSHYGHPFFVPCGLYYMYFCFGGAVYLIHRDGATPKLTAIACASFLLCIRQAVTAARWLDGFYHAHFSVIICAAIISASAALLILSNRLSRHLSPTANKVALVLGGITYPLYLLHSNIGFSVMDAYFRQADRWTALTETTAGIFALSAAVYFCFDKPVRARLRSRANQKELAGGWPWRRARYYHRVDN